VAIRQTVGEIWRFFDFSGWRPPSSWIFNNVEMLGVVGSRGSKCVFVTIAQATAWIWRYFDFFKMAAAAISDFKMWIF